MSNDFFYIFKRVCVCCLLLLKNLRGIYLRLTILIPKFYVYGKKKKKERKGKFNLLFVRKESGCDY